MLCQAEELSSQLLAAQFIQKPHGFIACRALEQLFQAILVTTASFIGSKGGGLRHRGTIAVRSDRALRFRTGRSAIRDPSDRRRRSRCGRNQFVEFAARGFRMRAIRMSGKE